MGEVSRPTYGSMLAMLLSTADIRGDSDAVDSISLAISASSSPHSPVAMLPQSRSMPNFFHHDIMTMPSSMLSMALRVLGRRAMVQGAFIDS